MDEIVKKIKDKLFSRKSLVDVFKNMGWLTFDKFFKLFTGFIVGIWVVRYLGPEQFGIWSYALAFVSFISIISFTGLSEVVVRDLIKDEKRSGKIMGTSFAIRMVGAILTFLVSLLLIPFFKQDFEMFIYVAIIAFGIIIQSFDVTELWFQARIRSKYAIIARTVSGVATSAFKLALIFMSAPLIYFVFSGLLDIAIGSVGIMYFYHKHKQSIRLWKFDKKFLIELLRDGWPLILSGIAIFVYMRIDQLMIGQMLGETELGLYSVAVKLAELWYFVPGIIVSSVLPAIISAKSRDEELYKSRFLKLYTVLAWVAIGIAIPVSVLSPYIVGILYGPEYVGASLSLAISIWGGVGVFLGTASTQYLVIEKKTMFSLYRAVVGMFINFGLNLVLIPMFGISGAAIATFVSYSLVTFSLFIFKDTREHAKLFFRALSPKSVFDLFK